MTRRHWVRLDNASNIFLAARSEIDSKVFRFTVELDAPIDPALLQQALDLTYDRYKLYHAVLRRAIFWYYLQDSDLRPVVMEDTLPTCAPIYDADRTGLLFRVVYYRQRISLEVFHALSDGTGAMWFLTDLMTEYVRLRYPGSRPKEDTSTAQLTAQPGAVDENIAARHLAVDSFTQYFRPGAQPTTRSHETPVQPTMTTTQRAYQVTGTRTPDYRTRAVELTAPANEVLALAKAENVSMSMYITALFFESIRRTDPAKANTATMAATIPVNLRQFFPSVSPRNFFTPVRIEHAYNKGPDDIGSVARALETQFRPKVTPEALEKKLRRLTKFERSPFLRIVPRPAKDVILRGLNWVNNRGLTVSVSNLGRVSLPDWITPHVGQMGFHVSAVRPQICVMSHAGLLSMSFTSPFIETDHIRHFARHLTDQGIAVTVAATRVTNTEIAEGAHHETL